MSEDSTDPVKRFISILQTMEGWKDFASIPQRVAELEDRVRMLERRGLPTAPPVPDEPWCPKCRVQMGYQCRKRSDAFGEVGAEDWTYKCPKCGESTVILKNLPGRR